MAQYQKPNQNNWIGRTSTEPHYIYQRVKCLDLEQTTKPFEQRTMALLGYACDEGVRRNHGRVGAKQAPGAIRKALGGFADHLPVKSSLIDFGDVVCGDEDLEHAHELITHQLKTLLDLHCFPLLLGGGHDLAYAHFRGIRSHFAVSGQNPTIGIINLDAHFDLRKVEVHRNSGTPFYQLAQETSDFHYLCLGIQPQANNKELYHTANEYGAKFMQMDQFHTNNWTSIVSSIDNFISKVDCVYLTIDMDGFSSAYAPGVSAPSPIGFDPPIVQKVIRHIMASQKLISADVVEFNPIFDKDNQTAKLAACVIYELINSIKFI
ncbi:MAG: formiminoglutamase [Cyclobacteriaceae bacterium]|jgi:formiminoglutamase